MAASILQLSELISSSVSSLIETCAQKNLQIPHLDEPFTLGSEAFRASPDVARAANIIAAAAFQLAASVLPPQESIFQVVSGHMKSAAMRVAIECNVPEILREAGSKGLHGDAIAEKSGVDGKKLARLLRYLANRHIFREVTPDVFANNMISGVLDTGKSDDEIRRDPDSKHDGTQGFVALAEMYISDTHKGSAYLFDNMKDPVTAHSAEINGAPLQRGLNTKLPYYEWFLLPEHAYSRRRFGVGVKGAEAMEPLDLILNSFDWGSLPKDAIVVDVGGGIGNAALSILRAHPSLRTIIQDTQLVVEDGNKFWTKEFPDALASGRAQFQAHDFFTPQPVKDASVFLLKHILHNWPDAQSVKLLTHLRDSAKPDTRLIIFDTVMPYTCRDTSVRAKEFGIVEEEIPGLSLSGFGAANEMRYTLDVAMLVWLNSQEHTIDQFSHLLQMCGWNIVKVKRGGKFVDCVQAIPI